MKIRAIAAGVALAAALSAGSALAQQGTVARLTGLEGNVLVSQGDAMAAATNGQRVPAGARVVTTAGAKVTVNYDVGCDISLKENQRFTVRLGECPALLAEVVPLGPAAGAIGGGIVAVSAPPVAVAAGIGIVGGLGYGVYETFRNKSVSPN